MPQLAGEGVYPNECRIVGYQEDILPGIVRSTHRGVHFASVSDCFVSPSMEVKQTPLLKRMSIHFNTNELNWMFLGKCCEKHSAL